MGITKYPARKYTEEQINTLNMLQKCIRQVYTSPSEHLKAVGWRDAQLCLEKIRDLFQLDDALVQVANQSAKDNLTTMTDPVGSSRTCKYQNDTFDIITLRYPNRVEFYQNFEIEIVLHNTGEWLWKNRVITCESEEMQPKVSLTELPKTQPDSSCCVRIPVNAGGTGGDFELPLHIYERRDNGLDPVTCYNKPIIIPIHVNFRPGAFGE